MSHKFSVNTAKWKKWLAGLLRFNRANKQHEYVVEDIYNGILNSKTKEEVQ